MSFRWSLIRWERWKCQIFRKWDPMGYITVFMKRCECWMEMWSIYTILTQSEKGAENGEGSTFEET